MNHRIKHFVCSKNTSEILGAAGPENHMGEELAGTHTAPTLSSILQTLLNNHLPGAY